MKHEHDPSLEFYPVHRRWEMLEVISTGELVRFGEYADAERTTIRLATLTMGMTDRVVAFAEVRRPPFRRSSPVPPAVPASEEWKAATKEAAELMRKSQKSVERP